MRAKSVLFVMLIAGGMFAFGGGVRADTMFVENFNDGTVGANLVNQGGNQVISGRVYTAAADYTQRNYLATNDSDYATSTKDWTLTVDVDNTNTVAKNYVRVGIGSGAPSGLWTNGTIPPNGWFNEPASALYLSIDMNTASASLITAEANGFPASTVTIQGGITGAGVARIKKVGGNLTFGWDQGSTGTFTETTVAISAYPMLSTSSRLFASVFEGNTTSSIDNFSVSVPEPAACLMSITGLFGLLAYAWRRRK